MRSQDYFFSISIDIPGCVLTPEDWELDASGEREYGIPVTPLQKTTTHKNTDLQSAAPMNNP